MPTIEALEIYRVTMPLLYPFRTAFGDEGTIESVLVRIGSGDLWGWGEAAPWRSPAYSAEWAAGVFTVIRDFLAPLILGADIRSGKDLQAHLAPVKGNPFAKAALDLAWWDLFAKSLHEPLWKTLGGCSPTVKVGADFGVMESIDRLLEVIGRALAAGFRRVKLKFRPGWDLPMVAAVREAFPEAVFHVDLNSAYTLDDLPMLKELDRYRLAMIEQPLGHDDLLDHAELARRMATPICLDESITSPAKARQAIALGACRWINIKPGRVGGLTPALAVRDICEAAGVPCWVGGMLESAVGAAHCLALATLPNIKYPSDIFPSDRFYTEDLAAPPMVLSGPSQMTASATAGVGAEPVPQRLACLTIERVALQA